MPSERKTILLCVLNWGIGHAARCVPLVEKWMRENKRVVIASDGAALQVLRGEFPGLLFEELPPYNVQYDKGGNMVFAMAKQLPKFINAINAEHKTLNNLVEKYQPEMVVSDSRFGCHTAKKKSVFITHQLHLIMPKTWKWMEQMVNHFNHKQIAKFDECWIPDAEGENNLSGKLSHPPLPNVRYIGTLSRFEKAIKTEKKFDVLAVLSGPEPQRTLLEEKLRKQLSKSGLKYLLVRGLPDKSTSKINEVNYMNASELSKAIAESKVVICRSGYSTVMDLMALQADTKIVFIPTPGQTEQEYLAKRLTEKGIGLCVAQGKFDVLKLF